MTTKLQKAIEIATYNGYTNRSAISWADSDVPVVIALDPQFWEALGKGLGWEKYNWDMYMNELMPHLQQGGTVEDYISSLID